MKINVPGIFQPLLQDKARYKVYYGGRGAAKSWSFAICLIVLTCSKNLRILCAREIQKSIDDSVYQLLIDTIYRLGLNSEFNITKTKITHNKTGSTIIFAGLWMYIENKKGLEGIDLVWIEEAETVSYKSLKYLRPTIRKEGSEFWISFNPRYVEDPVYNMFVDNSPPEGAIVVKVGWKDNPFFPDVLKKELEWDRATNFDDYLWIWEGELKKASNAQILKGKNVVKEFDYKKIKEETKQAIALYAGVDYGYSPDPLAIVRCFIHDQCLWIDYEGGGVALNIPDYLPELEKIPDIYNCRIATDHNYKSVTAMFQKYTSLTVHMAVKGKGSINDNVAFLKKFKQIIIHPRCVNVIKEARLWSYKVDKQTEEVTPEVLDGNDHWINALQYAISHLREKFIKKKYTPIRLLGVR